MMIIYNERSKQRAPWCITHQQEIAFSIMDCCDHKVDYNQFPSIKVLSSKILHTVLLWFLLEKLCSFIILWPASLSYNSVFGLPGLLLETRIKSWIDQVWKCRFLQELRNFLVRNCVNFQKAAERSSFGDFINVTRKYQRTEKLWLVS